MQTNDQTAQREAGSLQRPGSAATCDWLTTLEGKETCGKPATHIRKGGANLTYCYEHACELSAYTVLEMLPPLNAPGERLEASND